MLMRGGLFVLKNSQNAHWRLDRPSDKIPQLNPDMVVEKALLAIFSPETRTAKYREGVQEKNCSTELYITLAVRDSWRAPDDPSQRIR